MTRKLNTFVHVHDENGAAQIFGPSDDLPDWAANAITNPDVWADRGEAAPVDEPEAPVGDGPPPKGGGGSGAPAWREYAAKHNVEVADNASRDDVIAALDAAGVPTE